MRVVWLNNVQAPYREPMLRELAEITDFHAYYFFQEEADHHWVWRAHPGYRSEVVPAWRLPVPTRLAVRLVDAVGVLRPGVARRVLRGADALVTQVWWQPAHLAAIVGCRLRGIPYLIYAESTMDSRSVGGGLADRLRSWVFRNAGAVIVPGPAAAEAALVNGTAPERVVESVNSVDTELYGTGVRRLRSGDADDGRHRFVFIGRLVELKNVDSLIRAFAALDGDPFLEIAGDGIEEEHLRQLANECGVEDRIRFLGYLSESDVLALLARNQTLVLPSTKEVYGYVALEAHVAGLQVVVSELAGISRNLDGRDGVWVVDPTVPDLAAALHAARDAWAGWNDEVDVEFASPRRAARDILQAVEVARSGAPARVVRPTDERVTHVLEGRLP